jgi:hypothetical protein
LPWADGSCKLTAGAQEVHDPRRTGPNREQQLTNRPLLMVFLATLGCSGPSIEPASIQPVADEVANAAETITPTDMYARIAFLASDALRGRDTPSHGLEVAAEYIAGEFARIGLEPHGDSGTFLQRYPFTTQRLRTDSVALNVTTGGATTSFAFGSDLFVRPGTPAGANRELVFVGMSVPEASTELRDRIPIVFVSGAMDRTWRTSVQSARNAARSTGASALLVVLDPSITSQDIGRRATAFATTSAVTPVPVTGFVRYDRARELFKGAGQDLDTLIARARIGLTAPVRLANTTAQLRTPSADNTQRPPNVVAVLRGSDPELRNTYVVLSAHMDHIGVGSAAARGDSINNGADDDASGTSAVLEVAEAFAALPQAPARSIIFLTVSGEEKGLLGSRHFVEHPVVPLASMVANINIDMIGRNAPDSVVAIGQDYSSLGPLTQEVVRNHPELGITVGRDIWPQERFFFRSDHYNFARKEVPAIFFFAGVHEDYHRPSDEVERIDAGKAARIARLAYYLALEIANRREPPKWTTEGLNEVRALTR